eukprot:5619494-Pleurochrysis_carterae.AAC.1
MLQGRRLASGCGARIPALPGDVQASLPRVAHAPRGRWHALLAAACQQRWTTVLPPAAPSLPLPVCVAGASALCGPRDPQPAVAVHFARLCCSAGRSGARARQRAKTHSTRERYGGGRAVTKSLRTRAQKRTLCMRS